MLPSLFVYGECHKNLCKLHLCEKITKYRATCPARSEDVQIQLFHPKSNHPKPPDPVPEKHPEISDTPHNPEVMTFKSHPAADLFSPIRIEHDPSRAAVAIVNFWEIILKSRRKTLTIDVNNGIILILSLLSVDLQQLKCHILERWFCLHIVSQST